MITIRVLRCDGEKGSQSHIETYEIEENEKMKVLDALNLINEEHNAKIAFRSSCRAGQCGSCAVKMNGQVVLACKAEIEDGAFIEPLDFPVMKDLIVDRGEIEEKALKMKLFLERSCEDNTCPEMISPDECIDTKKIRSCIECFSCLSVCPVIKESSEYAGPYFMRYLSKFALDPRDKYDRALKGFEEGLYCCTTCGKCKEVCPKEISIPGDAIEKLRALACKESVGPLEVHKGIKKLISETGRSVDYLGDSLIKTVSSTKSGEKRSNVAFFTGCLVDYRMPHIGLTLLKILEDHGIHVDVPPGQVCCGSPMIRTGQLDIIEDLVKKNQEALKGYDMIITVCAGCGATLKKDYPKYGAKLNVMDISEFLVQNMDYTKLNPLNMKVTYHDPCHLARSQGIKIEPREVLSNIPGLEFVEMEEPNSCCGSGGGVKAGKPEIAASLGKKKAEMVKKLDVDALITICPFCQIHIKDSLEKEGLGDIKVLNILELLDMAYNQ
ncbi:fumarate reductase (CoM/CoB) subunit TfrB [Methanobacterium alcaliphilum]|uniref:fumarate reductase (CoM/CoB) subunit TfrB n=1 Tax=Methanobacterium alcaliphilum TaxID=392018 RepID=UPI00200A278F|nr:fumarate reductase (CoM/CoB) subunit TfrB [Methanobacterium alcaliphilum]MCK9151239.1 succinate dehydrogenase/fumarate reductase iron-sulfur subunit [Methanobacterium alcaliphilum]